MDNELRHYGIPQMKWGIRRFQNKDGSLTSAGRQRYGKQSTTKETAPVHEDYARAHSKASVTTMSDKELRDRLNRLQMEKQYNQLSSETVKSGKDYAKKALAVMTTAATVSTTAITLYNNADKIRKIVEGIANKSSGS